MKIFLPVLIFAVLLVGCQTKPPTITTSQSDVLVKNPSVAALIKENSVLLDVRPSFESQGTRVLKSQPLTPSDLGLKKTLPENNYDDIRSVLRRQGLHTETPVVMIADAERDAADLGYVGLILWRFDIRNVDVADIRHWRVRPVERAIDVPGDLTTDLPAEAKDIEVHRSILDQACSQRKCTCASAQTRNLPRRFLAACEPLEIPASLFWTADRIFKMSADDELKKMGLTHDKPVYVPWDSKNYFTIWALLRFGYDVKVVRLHN